MSGLLKDIIEAMPKETLRQKIICLIHEITESVKNDISTAENDNILFVSLGKMAVLDSIMTLVEEDQKIELIS